MNVFLDDIRETPAGYDRRTYTTLETRAIRIDASRANGFKNLGLAFEGRSRFVEAAFSYIMAIRADASDPRALHLLVNLAHSRRSLFEEIPDLKEQIRMCREAVAFAAKANGRGDTSEDNQPSPPI